MINECGTTHSVDLGLAIHAVGTVKLIQVTTNNTVKTRPNDENVNNSMGDERQVQGFGTDEWLG